MEKDDLGVPRTFGWRASGDWKPAEIRSPYIILSWRQVLDVICYAFRYFIYWIRKFRDPDSLFIDGLRPMTLFPYYGVSCGGLGCGSIGRDFRGAFCRFSLVPGMVEHCVTNVPENQFIVNVRRRNSTVYQRVLTAACPSAKSLKKLNAWRFDFPAGDVEYVGLYPRSWTVYRIPEQQINVYCRQISPVFPNDYKDTSLPCTVFAWSVDNYSAEPADVSICLTFRNGTGNPKWQNEGLCYCSLLDRSDDVVDGNNGDGVDLRHTIAGMECTYYLAGRSAEISTAVFDPTGNGGDIWDSLSENGRLEKPLVPMQNSPKKELGIALCASAQVEPFSTQTFDVALTWYMPLVWFKGKKRTYKRRYTRWFSNARDIGAYALDNYKEWERKIETWQNKTLTDESLPDWYKTALFNELYYLTDGGSVWFTYDEQWKFDERHLSDYTLNLMKQYDRFAYLESYEYRMYTTYDVHFYASFALACLFPRIEQCIQAEYCDQITNEDTEMFHFFYEGDVGYRKAMDRVPHDLGCPGEEPWLKTNAYLMHNTGRWKDLNLKYILTSMRDYFLLKDGHEQRAFLQHVWPTVQKLISVGTLEWDVDGDGMIENSGTCDQTYDTWRMKGTSAYCGSLWIGAVKCACQMAEILNDSDSQAQYKRLLKRATVAFDRKLWREDYYKFDEASADAGAVMSDQLCGYWYLATCGLEKGILPEQNVKNALSKIYQFNVGKFGGGKMGAVNGKLSDGSVDRVSMQSEEMWTGVAYSLSSLMINEGMIDEGFSTASGVYGSVFGPLGMQFQSPEAVYERKNYRALGYMRALAIWSIHWILNKKTFIDNA